MQAAALSWNPGSAPDLVDCIHHHIAGDRVLAEATVRLGRVDELIGPSIPETGTLASMLASPESATTLAGRGMTPQMLDAAERELESIIGSMDVVGSSVPDARVWADEVRVTAGWLRLAVWVARSTLGWSGAVEPARLVGEFGRLLGEHGRMWLARNRPGGLDDSLLRLSGASTLSEEDHDGVDHD